MAQGWRAHGDEARQEDGLSGVRLGNYLFAWGALIAIGLLAFTLQWLMDESPPKAHAGLVPA